MDLIELGRIVLHEESDYVYLAHGSKALYLARILKPALVSQIDLLEGKRGATGRSTGFVIVPLTTEMLEGHGAMLAPDSQKDVGVFSTIAATSKSICDEDRLSILATIRDPETNIPRDLRVLLAEQY